MTLKTIVDALNFALAGNNVIFVLFDSRLVDLELYMARIELDSRNIGYSCDVHHRLIRLENSWIRIMALDEARKTDGLRGAVMFDDQLLIIYEQIKRFLHCEIAYKRVEPTGDRDVRQ